MKCAWHGEPDCPLRHTENAVREFVHDHEEGVCKPECYGCFIILEAKKDLEAAVASANLQHRETAKMASILLDYIHALKHHEGSVENCGQEPCPATGEFLSKSEKRNDAPTDEGHCSIPGVGQDE